MKIGGNPPICVSHQTIYPPTTIQKSVGAYDIGLKGGRQNTLPPDATFSDWTLVR